MRKVSILCLIGFAFLLASFTSSDASSIVIEKDAIGVWLSENGQEKVQIYNQNGKYFGKIIWMKNPNDENGKPKTDQFNPDPARRKDPYVGLIILRDFEYDRNGVFRNGFVYDASAGKVYKGMITLESKIIAKVRGYIGIPLLGKTEITTKVSG